MCAYMHTYVSVCLFVLVHSCAGLYLHVEARREHQIFFYVTFCPSFWDRVFPWTWNSQFLGWAPVSATLRSRVTGMHGQMLVLMIVQWVLLTAEPPFWTVYFSFIYIFILCLYLYVCSGVCAVCASICVHMCSGTLWVCTCVPMCAWRPKVDVRYLLQLLSTLLWQDLLLNLNLIDSSWSS